MLVEAILINHHHTDIPQHSVKVAMSRRTASSIGAVTPVPQPFVPSQVHQDTPKIHEYDDPEGSETESDDEVGELFKRADVGPTQTAPMLSEAKTNAKLEEDPIKLDHAGESQDGISQFRIYQQTPRKTYGKSRKLAFTLSRGNSTASTIPESDHSNTPRLSTSFVAGEAATRSVKEPSLGVGGHLNGATPVEDVQRGNDVEDSSTHLNEAFESVSHSKVASMEDDLDAAEEDGLAEPDSPSAEASSKGDFEAVEAEEDAHPESQATPALNVMKRKSEAQSDAPVDEEDARFLKVPRRDDSSLDIVVASVMKQPTPSRSAKQPSSTKQTRDAQRASKTPATTRMLRTPATPALRSSATPKATGKVPNKVLLSSSKLSVSEKSWLKRQTTVVEEVPGRRSNFVCVVRQTKLPATLKVLRSLIANKPVVSDQWVSDSKDGAELLDPTDYLHKDLRESDIKPNDRRRIWEGKTLFFTTTAAKSYGEDWEDVKVTGLEAGASSVVHGSAIRAGELLHDKANTILFGTDVAKDREAQALIAEYGRSVYDKHMFAQAIIRADVDLDSDDFKLVLPTENLSKTKMSRDR